MTSADWFTQASMAREKAAELRRLAAQLQATATTLAASSSPITQVFDTTTWGGERAQRTGAVMHDTAGTIRYVAQQATIDADELNREARTYDETAETCEAEGKRQAYLEAEAEAQAARQRQAAANAASSAKASAATSQTANTGQATTSTPPPQDPPKLIFAPIETTPAPTSEPETTATDPTDSYNF
jgi:hypothetical protein